MATYVSAGLLAKIAIAIFFNGFARNKIQKWIIVAPLAVYIITMGVCFLLLLFRCGLPIEILKILSQEHCQVSGTVALVDGYSLSIENATCDWVFASIPIYWLIEAENMSKSSRNSILGLVGLAVIGSMISIGRIPAFTISQFGPTYFENVSTVMLLSLIETQVAITTISLACLKPFINRMFGSCRPSAKRNRSGAEKVANPLTIPQHGPGGPDDDDQQGDEGKDVLSSAPPTAQGGWIYAANVPKEKTLRLAARLFGGIGVLPDTLNGTLNKTLWGAQTYNGTVMASRIDNRGEDDRWMGMTVKFIKNYLM